MSAKKPAKQTSHFVLYSTRSGQRFPIASVLPDDKSAQQKLNAAAMQECNRAASMGNATPEFKCVKETHQFDGDSFYQEIDPQSGAPLGDEKSELDALFAN